MPSLRLPIILLLLLAGCGEAPPIVLVHASDPHLLDPTRQPQEALNWAAFEDMIVAVRNGDISPRPNYLVITGDFGLEATDPRFTPGFDRVRRAATDSASDSTTGPVPYDSVGRADHMRRQLAYRVAAAIRTTRLERVFFVPGNNDVLLEDADRRSWSGIGGFVNDVNDSLPPTQRFVDLTACYRMAAFHPADCIARIDTPYVLVGFPTISLKNNGMKATEYQKYVDTLWNGDAQIFNAAMRERMHSQDSLHQILMNEFAQVVANATAGGHRRAVVLTHIPDLDDPFIVGRRATSSPFERGPRLSPTAESDAWNATPPIFEGWKRIVESRSVVGVLAGHFHDPHREIYRRPYLWSTALGRADRWKLLVVPPLSVKNQDASPVQARGFAVVTLGRSEPRRRLHWYDPGARRFAAEATDEGAGSDRSDATLESSGSISPAQNLTHRGFFALAFLAAFLATLYWGPPTRESEHVRSFKPLYPIIGFAAASIAVLAGRRSAADAVPFTIFWFVTLFFSMLLIRSIQHGVRSIYHNRTQMLPLPRTFVFLHAVGASLLGPTVASRQRKLPAPAEKLILGLKD